MARHCDTLIEYSGTKLTPNEIYSETKQNRSAYRVCFFRLHYFVHMQKANTAFVLM